jgi:hypothetical protein
MGTRSAIRGGLAGAALAAAILVPSASAHTASGVKLALVALPKTVLGSAGRHLPLQRDSGSVSNAEAANDAAGSVTAQQLVRLGRVTGYVLDYGNPLAKASGVSEIQTGIDRYRSAADARKGLGFWRRDELKNALLKKLGIGFSLRRLRPSGMPGPHWVYAGTVSIKGLPSLRGVDAEFQQGKYVLDLSISGRSTAAAARLVPKVARRLDRRLQLALAGRLHGRPVSLPRPLKPGPPAHGPKPADLALTATDVGTPATVVHKGYAKPKNAFDPNALSVYDLTMAPAGPFAYVSQEVVAASSTLEAQYFGAIAAAGVAAGLGKNAAVTTVDLSAVGDHAYGEVVQVTVAAQTVYEAVIVLSHGPYIDLVASASTSAVTSADVSSFARRVATRLDAGF